MWCWCSNVVISVGTGRRRGHWKEVTTEHHRLGIHANMESSNSISSKQEKQEISGSDVLWALQKRVSTSRKKKKKKESSSSSAPSRMEEIHVDYYTDVRPLCINDYWGPKLDQLEKRLRHLSQDTL
ncbi:hypothetical protein MtrunA17_Chr7g0276211 [Medicago truncatula]|uniref:Uncharacterized protein n=1 Tax=Medicago truncatula TaxID=3880 RepID=Q2HTD5_MEDTR|nr:uncharacterized protein LOC11425701 [Medicago truncatula]ABD32696.1 hypothetical protein MtrDRAFT_AC150443g4v2 [Medicago truncatula]AES82816.1 hypothetical protein MTR_7g118130 [Medicago truncatula]RHN49597.1 hypothetical protein MtrunA17_Chr7g0276211 [Medicago truncatula]